MTKRVQAAILGIVIILMSTFMCLGYASLTDDLKVDATASFQIPQGLFITNIKVKGSSNIDHQTAEYIQYSTTVDATIDKKDDTVTSSGGWRPTQTTTKYTGTVTYEITVYNNTQYEYAYRGLYYQKTEFNNSQVATAANDGKLGVVTAFPEGSIVAPRESLTFTVTYSVGKNLSGTTDWHTLLNFQFGINVDSIDAAANIVLDKFADILNTSSTYLQLVDVLDDKFDGQQEWTSNYVGNVGNAVDNDMMTVETLFAGQLTMMVNGKAQKAWVIIKHENLDGDENTGDDYTVRFNQYGDITYKGCEMTMYMTVDQLDKANSWAPVYATVFTRDKDANGNNIGEWYKLGDTYYGEANVVGYKGESGGTGSFVTDNWRSFSSSYKVTDNYSYNVGSQVSIKSLVQTFDQTTVNEFQRLLQKAEAIIANPNYAGSGITVVEQTYAEAAKFYTLNGDEKAIANADTKRVWLIPIMNDLDYVLTVAQDAIDRIEQGKE